MTKRSSEPDRAVVLAARLDELGRYWLEIRCGDCDSTTVYPCRLLGMQHGDDLRLADVVARLRCRHCRQRPATVAITDDATGGVPGRGKRRTAWTLPLVP